MWVLAAVMLALAGVCAVTLAPFSPRITFLWHALPLFAAAGAAFATVLSLGKAATCRPQLQPQLVQPWLPPVSTAASTKKTE